MYRKLIISALAGVFLLGLAALGQAQTLWVQETVVYTTIIPAPHYVTSNWPGTSGTNAADLLASNVAGTPAQTDVAHRSLTNYVTSNWPGTSGTDAADLLPSGVAGTPAQTELAHQIANEPASAGFTVYTEQAGYHMFDSRDPANGLIRPGGVIVYP